MDLRQDIGDIKGDVTDEGFSPVRLSTDRGMIEARYYESSRLGKSVIFVGGVGGNFDTPAKGLYPRLCRELMSEGIGSLRVSFRHPTILDESVFDVLAALDFLQRRKGTRVAGLVGHSFGGAVVIKAAVLSDLVYTIVTLATQCYGAEAAAQLKRDCSILLIHGLNDPVLPAHCSSKAYNLAKGKKRLSFYKGAGHGLDESAEEVHKEAFEWIIETLGM